MKVGIIGAGAIGMILARKLIALGHSVTLSNSRAPDTINALAAEIGATAVPVSDAIRDAGMAIVAIPMKGIAALPPDVFKGLPDDFPIIDTGNYFPSFRDDAIESIDKGMTESRWVTQTVGHSVVKVFGSITAYALDHYGLAWGRQGRIALPVAADNQHAKAKVIGFVEAIGFDAVDAGNLDDSWRQQPGTPAYCTDYDAAGVRLRLSRADRSRSIHSRELALEKLRQLPKGYSQQDLVNLFRSIHDRDS